MVGKYSVLLSHLSIWFARDNGLLLFCLLAHVDPLFVNSPPLVVVETFVASGYVLKMEKI